MREKILDLLSGKKIDLQPVFSGLIHITTEGLASEGLSLDEAHHDAKRMAKAAASTFRLTRIPSAALPLDLCAPAEALGAELNFYEGITNLFPQPKKALFATAKYLNEGFFRSADFLTKGRLPLICEAIRLLKGRAAEVPARSAPAPPRTNRQRSGGAYNSPPSRHRRFTLRSMPSGVMLR